MVNKVETLKEKETAMNDVCEKQNLEFEPLEQRLKTLEKQNN